MTSTHAVHHTLFALSFFFTCAALLQNFGVPQVNHGKSNFVWPILPKLLFHVQIGGAFKPSNDEIDLALIALSCHFALEVLCYEEEAHGSP